MNKTASTASRWFSLRFDDPALILPAVISATGKLCGGRVFTLVLTPYTGGVVYLVRSKDGAVLRWTGSGDAPGEAVVATKNAPDIVSRALAAKPTTLLGLNREWNGRWTGTVTCSGEAPQLQLERKVAGAHVVVRTLPRLGWAWSVELAGDRKHGTASKLRDAVSYARGAMRELIASREATRVTGERKATGPRSSSLDRAKVRTWTRKRVARPSSSSEEVPF